jgi:hypothetical protein
MFFNNSYLILNVNTLQNLNFLYDKNFFLKNEHSIIKNSLNFSVINKYKNVKNNNLFLIKNKYNFNKLEFGFFNSAKEERINQKFLKTLIERSVDLFLIKKINSLYFILKKINFKRIFDNKQLFFSIENNHLDIKKFYFRVFVSKLKKLLLIITNFDMENLNYFTKKKILNFFFYDNNQIFKKENLTSEIFRFSFSLIFQKIYLDSIIFNHSKFFFFDIIEFFKKKSLFFILNKKLIVSRSFLFLNKRYFLLYLYNKNRGGVVINRENNLRLFNFKNFYQMYNNFDILNRIQNFHLFVNLKENKINFYFEQKINNFYFKIGILNNLNFFFSFNKFFQINVYLKFVNLESFNFNKNIYFNNNKLIQKTKSICFNFSKYNFLKKYSVNSFYKTILKKSCKNYFYFFIVNNIKTIVIFNDNFNFLIFNIYEFFYDMKVEKINFFNSRLLKLYYFLRRNKNLFLEHLNFKKMDQRTYYKKYFLKEKYKDLFSTFKKGSLYVKNKKYFKKGLKYNFFDNFKFFSDIFFKKIFNINIFLTTVFSKKIEIILYLRKFFKNFIYFLFLNSRNIYNEYKLIFLNLLYYLQTQKTNNFFLEKFDFFYFNDKKIFNKYKFLLKESFSNSLILKQNNFLSFLLKNFSKKIFLEKFFNKKLDFLKSYLNFFINIQQKFLNILKYKQLVNFFNRKILSSSYIYYHIKSVFFFLKDLYILKQKKLNFFYSNNIVIKKNFNMIKNFFIFSKIFNHIKIFYFNTYKALDIDYKIQYSFLKNNKTLLLNYLNKFLNTNLLNTKNIIYENKLFNIFSNNFFSNLHLFINNIFGKNLNFQNFEFLCNFENFSKTIFNIDILSFKKTKIHFKFFKNLVFLYLNTIFLKKQYFLVTKFFFKIKKKFVLGKNEKNFIFKNKIFLIYNKLNLNCLSIKKKKLFLTNNYYLKFLYFKNFFYKFFFFPYSKIVLNFLKFLKTISIKRVKQDFLNFHSLNLKFYSFFFKFLTKKNKNKQNLLWLKINITRRNVFVNLFLNRKKPSVFVFTAGQTFFEGKLKKSKQAGMLIGRKLWKRLVILSKKNFFNNDMFFLNFEKIFKIKCNKKINNYGNEITSFLKKYLINFKKIFSKIIINKNKIIKLLNQNKISLYNKTKIIKSFLKQNGIKNFYKFKYFNQKKNINLFNYNNTKLYFIFFQSRRYLFFFLTIYIKVFENLKFIFIKNKFFKFSTFNNHIFKISFRKILKKKVLIKSNFPLKIIKIKYSVDESKNSIFLYNLYNSYKKLSFIIFNPLKKIILFFNLINKSKKINDLKLKKKKFQKFFFLLNIKLKRFIFIKFFFMKDLFYLNKIKSIFLIKRKKKLFKKLNLNRCFLTILKKKIRFYNTFYLIKKTKNNRVVLDNQFLKVKNFEFKGFLNLINNKKLNKINRLKYFLIITIRKKFNENLNKFLVFFKDMNFLYHFRFKFLYIYKYNNFFYKTTIKLKKFFIKFKLYNYFLFSFLNNNGKFYKKNKMLKKIYLKIKNFSIFSYYIDSLFKKIKYLWKKKLFQKIFFNIKKDSQKKNFDSIKFIFLYFIKLKSIFKFFITNSNLILNNFKKTLNHKKKLYFRIKTFYQIFFDYLKDAYSLVNSLIYSNLLYKFLMFDKNRKNKDYLLFFTLFKRLKYILFNFIKKNFLDLKKYTNLYKIISYKKKFRKRSLLYLRKKKITKKKTHYIKLLKKNKFKVVKFYQQKPLTFHYWKFFKIQIYNKNFKYSLFFNLRFNYFNVIKKYFLKRIPFITVSLNLHNKREKNKNQFFYKSFNIFNSIFLLKKIKKKKKLFKRNFKNEKFDRYKIFKQKQLLWLKNLKNRKKLFYKKVIKNKRFLFKNYKTLSYFKINKFLNIYFLSNFFVFKYFKYNIKVLKKIFFFKKILQIYFLFYKIIKKYKNSKKKIIKYRKYKFFIKYFIKLFLKRFVLLKNKHLKIYLRTSLKKIVLNFFVTKKKLLSFFYFNFLIRNKRSNLKIINFKFFHSLNYILNKKIKKNKNYFNNNLNIFYLKINSLLFKKFIDKIELKKNCYFFFNKKVKFLAIIINFNKILKIKNKIFVYNKYKILINCKNFINYKKFFINNFFFFFKYIFKKILKKKIYKSKNKKIILFARKIFLKNSYGKTMLSSISKNTVYLRYEFYFKIKLKYNVLFYIFKFYKYFIIEYKNAKGFFVTTFFRNSVILNKKIKTILNFKKKNQQRLKNLKKINLFLNLNNIKNKINFNKFMFNSNLSKALKINNLSINEFIKKNHFISKKFFKANKLKTFSLNFLTSMVFFNKFRNIIFTNNYLLTNKISLLNFFSLKKSNKNIFKRWRKKYYSNFDNKFFVPRRGFLLILSQKRNRVIRGILKGFVQQARGKKLLKRLKPRFVKIKKFIFTRSRKVKGKRK